MFSGLPTGSYSVGDLFSSPFHFTVPCYQRPYSWTTKEAAQLLEDVHSAVGDNEDPDTGDPDYFLGTILLKSAAGGDLPRSREREPQFFEIVDGQQRLVTLAILIAVLRDLEKERWLWGGNKLDQLISADSAATKVGDTQYRVELSGREQSFLRTHVQPRGACGETPTLQASSPAEERLFAVREYFVSELTTVGAAERKRLTTYLCDRCHFVAVLARDIDRAHRLFTVLNDRGRALLRNDILKAELLNGIRPERQDHALTLWADAADSLGPNFEIFFSHLARIHGRGDTKIISSVRQIISKSGGAEAFLDNVFAPLARAYHCVCSADDVELTIDAEARRYLIYLGRLSEGDWAPAAILALSKYQDDPARAKLLLKEIDRLAHLLRLLRASTGKRIRRFATVIDVINSDSPIVPGEGPFRISREETRNIGYHLKNLYRRDQGVCKLLLLRLSDEISRSMTVLDPRDYSVEHILPMRPGASSEWRRWFPDTEEREICTESLGNLVPVTPRQNDRARNQDFSRKQEIYRGSIDDPPVLAITRDAIEAEVWTASEIATREAKLFGLIRDIWGIEVDGMRGGFSSQAQSLDAELSLKSGAA